MHLPSSDEYIWFTLIFETWDIQVKSLVRLNSVEGQKCFHEADWKDGAHWFRCRTCHIWTCVCLTEQRLLMQRTASNHGWSESSNLMFLSLSLESKPCVSFDFMFCGKVILWKPNPWEESRVSPKTSQKIVFGQKCLVPLSPWSLCPVHSARTETAK